jgi:hypothetical protein
MNVTSGVVPAGAADHGETGGGWARGFGIKFRFGVNGTDFGALDVNMTQITLDIENICCLRLNAANHCHLLCSSSINNPMPRNTLTDGGSRVAHRASEARRAGTLVGIDARSSVLASGVAHCPGRGHTYE